jgi:1,4-alpha-glucan branching enzyme
MWAWPGKKLLFMGSEFAQTHEWKYNTSLDWHLCQYPDHEGVRLLVRDLNRLYTGEPVLSANDFNPQSFRWISCEDAGANLIAYLRTDAAEQVLFAVVGHFAAAVRRDYRVGVPQAGAWEEVINTNSRFYGGSGLGNDGVRHSEPIPAHGHQHSLKLTLPPLTTTIFRWRAV